jgi:hypothetical protein
MMDMSRRNWRKNEPVDLGEPEQPQVLRRAIELIAEARNYTIDDLASEVALPPSALEPFRLTLDNESLPEVIVT